MKIEREDYKGVKVEFSYSPLFEMFCSLHVLFNHEHHKQRIDWAEKMKSSITKKLYDKLSFYSDLTGAFDSLMDYCEWDDVMNGFNVIKAINQIEKYPIKKFVKMIFQDKLTETQINRILILKKVKLNKLRQSQVDFLLNPHEMKDDFITALKEYYYLYFQNEHMDIEAYMIRTLKAHKSLCDQMVFLEYINMLHPRIEVSEEKITLHKFRTFDMYFKDLKRIEIRISTFIDPHLLVNMKSNYLMLCIRAKLEERICDVHEDLVMTLKAFGDKTRIQMIKHMYSKPTSTQELALLLDISEAAVSKHLKMLHTARIINKIRKGNYILYFLDSKLIDMLPMNIYQYLDE